MVMPYHLHMPSYFLETFTEYPNLPMCPRAALWSRMAIGTWANSHIIQLSNSMIFNAETITAMV